MMQNANVYACENKKKDMTKGRNCIVSAIKGRSVKKSSNTWCQADEKREEKKIRRSNEKVAG
jgi:hypothetical protein